MSFQRLVHEIDTTNHWFIYLERCIRMKIFSQPSMLPFHPPHTAAIWILMSSPVIGHWSLNRHTSTTTVRVMLLIIPNSPTQKRHHSRDINIMLAGKFPYASLLPTSLIINRPLYTHPPILLSIITSTVMQNRMLNSCTIQMPPHFVIKPSIDPAI